jgi:HTH-type transcriptional regulator, competence development regulator
VNFGSYIRQLRKEKDKSIREFADQIGIDFTYLSKIENGKVDPPSEEKIRLMARELEVDAETLLGMAGKISAEQIRKVVDSNPNVGVLLRKIQSRKLTSDQIEGMLNIAKGNEKGAGDDQG